MRKLWNIKSQAAAAVFLFLSFPIVSSAKVVRYELQIKNEKVNMSGKKEVDFALTVNGGIPAPTLEFTEGDDAEILVKNELPGKEEVSIHWHGILLPPKEDGVPYANTPPIFPGTSRLFKFKIRQHGTYWYHSHTMLQEQKGVYGAIVIHPKTKTIRYDKDVVVVLSDWSDENADQIVRNLRKDGDFYLYKKDSVRSIGGALRAGKLKNYFANEWQRMGGMDLSDVGYDAFLINGKKSLQLADLHPGQTARVRIINAAASSYFYVSMGGTPMKVISADGMDIEPLNARELLIGMAETYDILFTPEEHKNFELRATVQDITGFASGWIGMESAEKVSALTKEPPDLYASMDHSSMSGMDHSSMPGMDHSKMPDMDHSSMPGMDNSKMDHSKMDHSSMAKVDSSTMDHSMHAGHATNAPKTEENLRTVSTLTVNELKAPSSTVLPKDKKALDVKLVLGGDMERYIWHINGKAIHEDRTIEINEGDIIRFTFVNETMMHHPMHLHGHFFRVLNQFGDKSPLKHTVDVPPHGTRTIEFYANEPGQWMLHCHNLYHMETGMARLVKYSTFTPQGEMAVFDKQDPHLHEHIYSSSSLEFSSVHAEASLKLMRTWDELLLDFESRRHDTKQFSFEEPWENEGSLVYRRWYGNFLNFNVGGESFDRKGYGLLGVGYILPLLIDSEIYVSNEGKIRMNLEKRFQWTKNLFSEVELSWRPNWSSGKDTEIEASFMYGPSWYWSAGLMATDKNIGVGAKVRF